MKLLNIIACVTVLLVVSCKKDEIKRIASPVEAATLTSSQSTIVLSKDKEEEQAVSFGWLATDFGYAAAITNVLQIAPKGRDFVDAKEITLAAGTNEINYTTLEFNGILLALELPVEKLSELELRIKSTIASTVAPQYSNVITLMASPYAAISYLYMPGAYQGWVPETAESLVSPTSNGIYTGIIQFPEIGSMFKITLERNWDNSYGQAENGALVLNGGTDIKATLAGNVEVTVNTNAFSITYKQHTWGLIGDATSGGWEKDTPMKYNNTTQLWTGSFSLKKGNLKFRKNNDWGTNYGLTDGVLVLGGGDIPIAEDGDYNVTLDLTNEKYTLVKQ